jgi:hypothetical protein
MHTDPELLGLLALGEDVGTEDERRHAETCPECAAELADLQLVVTLGRSVDAETAMAVPSDDVWDRIRDELGLASSLEPPVHQSRFLTSDGSGSSTTVQSVDATLTAEPVHKRPRRSLLSSIQAALSRSSHGSTDELTAHATLTPVTASWSAASGEAEIATDEHGRRILQVALHADLPTSGVRQAWLIHRDDPNVKQTLGILDGPHGLWTVDQSIDLEQYPILDISQQGTGETEHSGQTIVRGQLALIS